MPPKGNLWSAETGSRLAQELEKHVHKMQKESSLRQGEKEQCPTIGFNPCEKPSYCQACGVETDQYDHSKKVCRFCISACKKVFGHRSVVGILGCASCKKAVTKESQKCRDKQPKRSQQPEVSKDLLKSMTLHLGQVVQCIQGINAQQDLEGGHVKCSKKRKAK